MKNPVLEATTRHLDELGFKHEVEHRGKHLELSWANDNGRLNSVFMAATPSDWRAPRNALAFLKRKLRNGEGKPAALPFTVQHPRTVDTHQDARVRQAPNPARSRLRDAPYLDVHGGRQLRAACQPKHAKGGTGYTVDLRERVQEELLEFVLGAEKYLTRREGCFCRWCRIVILVTAMDCGMGLFERLQVAAPLRLWLRRCDFEQFKLAVPDISAAISLVRDVAIGLVERAPGAYAAFTDLSILIASRRAFCREAFKPHKPQLPTPQSALDEAGMERALKALDRVDTSAAALLPGWEKPWQLEEPNETGANPNDVITCSAD